MVQPEPYISHFNESAVQVLNSHREQRSVEEKFPPQVLTSFPAVKVPQATRRRVEEIQSSYTAMKGKSAEIFLACLYK